MVNGFDIESYYEQYEPGAVPASYGENEPFDPAAYAKEVVEVEEEREKYDNDLLAGMLGLARGLTFRGSDLAITKLGLMRPEDLKKTYEYNPWAAGVTEGVGIIAPTILSGGTGLIPGAVRGAGSLVRGAARVGSMVERGVGAALSKKATQTAVRKIADTAIKKGAGLATEGTFYATGNVASEYAMGDPGLTAEKAIASVGLGTLISGGAGSFLGGMGKGLSLLKGKTNIGQAIENTFTKIAKISGISDDTIQVIKNRSKELGGAMKRGDTPEDAINALAIDSAAAYDDQGNKLLGEWLDNSSYAIFQSDKKDLPLRLSKIIGGVRAGEKKAISYAGQKVRGVDKGFTAFHAKAAKEAEVVENTLREVARNNLRKSYSRRGLTKIEKESIEREILNKSDRDLFLYPDQVNLARQHFGKAAKYSKPLGVAEQTPVEDVYKGAEKAARKILTDTIPELKPINKKIAASLQAQQKLGRKFGFQKGDTDSDKLLKLFKKKTLDPGDMEAIRTLDKLYGTTLEKDRQIVRAIIELNSGNAFTRVLTGVSLYPFIAGAALIPFVGPHVGMAIGGLGALGMAPALTQPMIRYSDKLIKMAGGGIKKLSTAADITRRATMAATPWAAAQSSMTIVDAINNAKDANTLASLERSAVDQDKVIDDSIRDYFRETPTFKPSRPQPTGVLARAKTREGRVREFNKQAQAITVAAADPVGFTNKIEEQLGEIAEVAPETAKNIAIKGAMNAQLAHSLIPKNPMPDAFQAEQNWEPSDRELMEFESKMEVLNNPLVVLKRLKNGTLSIDDVNLLKVAYPQLYDDILFKTLDIMSDERGHTPYRKRVESSVLFGAPLDAMMNPTTVALLQGLSQEATDQEKIHREQPKMRMAGVDKIDAAERVKPQSSRPEFR